jgi:hypothetical protein
MNYEARSMNHKFLLPASFIHRSLYEGGLSSIFFHLYTLIFLLFSFNLSTQYLPPALEALLFLIQYSLFQY